ncbi:MAG: hypothetical protein ABEJ06_02095 [Haloarculaceae archaeon]
MTLDERRVRAAVGGVLAELLLLVAALLPISHRDPPSVLALGSGLAIGFVGGVAAAHLGGDRQALDTGVALVVGGVGGAAFATVLASLVLTDGTTGVFWHFHYLLAITVPPPLVVEFGAAVVVAFALLCGLAVAGFAVFGTWLATHLQVDVAA